MTWKLAQLSLCWTLAAATAPLMAQTGIPNLDKMLKKVERLAASAPTQRPAAESPAEHPAPRDAAKTPAQTSGAAPDSSAKLDLGSEAVQPEPAARARAEPDLVDLKLGMSPQQAADALARRYPSAIRKAVKGRWDSPVKAEFIAGMVAIDAKKVEYKRIVHGEYVQLAFAPPPNQPVVVGITRKVLFAIGQEANREEWVKSLEAKYGRATVRQDLGGTDVAKSGYPVGRLVWYFDKARTGDPKAANGPLSKRCVAELFAEGYGMNFAGQMDDTLIGWLSDGRATNAYTNWRTQAAQWEDQFGFCGRSLRVTLIGARTATRDTQRADNPLLGQVDLWLSDDDAAAAAARKTNALLAGAANKAATQRVEQSKQNKPTL